MAEPSTWNIRQVYLYLVSFATLMMLIVGTVQLINGLVDMVYPDRYPYPKGLERELRYTEMTKAKPGLTQAQINRLVAEEERAQEAAQKRMRIKRLINSLALVLVALPIYTYHWRKIQRGGIGS